MKKIKNTRIVPVTLKILVLFTLFILVSNLTTNYINLVFNRTELVKLMKQLLVKDLKSIIEFCNTQNEIYQYTGDLKGSIRNIEGNAYKTLVNKKAVVIAITTNGRIFFQASKIPKVKQFTDLETLNFLNKNKSKNILEKSINFKFNNEKYFGVYKYNDKWNVYIIRGEELNEFYKPSRDIFKSISIIILIFTLLISIVGMYVLNYILRFIKIISNNIMDMVKTQKLNIIDLKDAPNDDITFLGVAFNSLSSTIDTLINIFRKFATRDVAVKAYKEKIIKLEGQKNELTILFSDIKSFTFITETLGTDIIKLLNMHYDKAIREILEMDGIIGSIIGDAILAVFGTVGSNKSKSYNAVISAYRIQEVAASLRLRMYKRREEIVKKYGALTEEEERVYKAVLLEVGVGIDGGEVFYGNIGSYVRMTNTVIGDTVNSASRLEGLTRIYKVPVICSEYIMKDIEENVPKHNMTFVELDKVKVKGKTIGKKVYWPIFNEDIDKPLLKNINLFSKGLKLYFDGNWKEAYKYFKRCTLPMAKVFTDRTKNNKCPRRWNGVWTMTTK